MSPTSDGAGARQTVGETTYGCLLDLGRYLAKFWKSRPIRPKTPPSRTPADRRRGEPQLVVAGRRALTSILGLSDWPKVTDHSREPHRWLDLSKIGRVGGCFRGSPGF